MQRFPGDGSAELLDFKIALRIFALLVQTLEKFGQRKTLDLRREHSSKRLIKREFNSSNEVRMGRPPLCSSGTFGMLFTDDGEVRELESARHHDQVLQGWDLGSEQYIRAPYLCH